MTWQGGFTNEVATIIAPGAVGSTELADDAVTSAKIAVNLQSDNWNGTTVAAQDATQGWRIEKNTGNFGAENVFLRGTIDATAGNLGTLSITGTLTMGTGGIIRTSSTSTRLEISNASTTRLDFYQGGASPGAKLLGGTGGAQSLRILADTFDVSNTADTSIRFTVTSGGVNAFSNINLLSSARILNNFGTATAPAFSFLSDNDTGMFRDNANRVAFSVGTNLALTIAALNIEPHGDNVKSLGTSARRWVDVWAVDTSINSSDRREKEAIQPLQFNALEFVNHLHAKQYKRKERIRIHTGFIAQELAATLRHFDLDLATYIAPKRKDQMKGIRTSELLAILWQAVSELNEKVEALAA